MHNVLFNSSEGRTKDEKRRRRRDVVWKRSYGLVGQGISLTYYNYIRGDLTAAISMFAFGAITGVKRVD